MAILVFLIYAICYLFANTAKQTKWFLTLVVLPLLLFIFLSDMLRHSGTSMLWRYQIVNMVAVTFVVTYLLKDTIAKGRLLFMGVYLGLVFLGILSVLVIADQGCWNTSRNCEPNVEEARLISQAPHPLVITDFSGAGLVNFMAVLNKSKAKNADVIYANGTLQNLKQEMASNRFSEIYVIEASESLTHQLKLQFGENMVPLRKNINMFTPQIWRISDASIYSNAARGLEQRP